MSTTPRQRLSVRLGLSDPAAPGPFAGVPQHLLQPLQQWIDLQFDDYHGLPSNAAEIVCLRLRQVVPARSNARRFLAGLEDFALLDAVDATLVLRTEGWGIEGDPNGVLEFILSEGGSAYRVSEDGACLEWRVGPTTAAAVDTAINEAAAAPSAGSASEHLGLAWKAAYGLHPDPVRAYSESIKAVESAAHAVVQPNHVRATLGTMLGEIGAARAKFTTAIATTATGDPVAVVETMMRTLWDGQTSRHGKQTPTRQESLEAARAAVYLAVTLVQWFVSGAVTRNP